MYGLAYGYTVMTPIYMCYLYFPSKKSMVSGIQKSTGALAAGIVPFIQMSWLNPDFKSPNPRPIKEEYPDEAAFDFANLNYKQFDQDLANNFPITLRKMGIIYATLSIIMFVIFPFYPATLEEDED